MENLWRGEQQKQTQMGAGSRSSFVPIGKRGEWERGSHCRRVAVEVGLGSATER